MDKKEKHISQKHNSIYPKPSVPAGNGWANMKDMLDVEMPLSEVAMPGKYAWIKSLKFIIPASIVLTASVIFWNYNLSKRTNSAKQIIVIDSFFSSETDAKSDQKKIKEENENYNDSSIKKVKTDFDNVNTLNLSSKTQTINASKAINSSSVKSSAHLENSIKVVNKTKSKNLDDNKKSVFANSTNAADFKKPVKIKVVKEGFGKNNAIEKSVSDQIKSDKNFIKRNVGFQQNKFASEFSKKSSFNEKTSLTGLNDDVLKKAFEKKIAASFLIAKSSFYSNQLKQKFDSINIVKTQVKALPNDKKSKVINVLSKDIHAGLQWNVNIPMKGYDQFFTGANNKSNQLYTLLIPGIWIEKKLNNGNGIMLKLNPYSQYFGNNKLITSSTTSLTDSTSYNSSVSLIKISGISGGIQYNQHIYNRLSIGIGTNIYWQNRALLNNIVSDSATKVIMSNTIYSVKETSNEGKYLNLYFVSTNIEMLYTWRMFQFGGGIAVPVTSMTGISDKKIRPVSGQLVFRWRLK